MNLFDEGAGEVPQFKIRMYGREGAHSFLGRGADAVRAEKQNGLPGNVALCGQPGGFFFLHGAYPARFKRGEIDGIVDEFAEGENMRVLSAGQQFLQRVCGARHPETKPGGTCNLYGQGAFPPSLPAGWFSASFASCFASGNAAPAVKPPRAQTRA